MIILFLKNLKKSFVAALFFVLIIQSCGVSDTTPVDDSVGFVVPATKDIVMYEINIGSFSSEGNLNGIINRLDPIQALGISTIWLMPIHPIGTLNSIGPQACEEECDSILKRTK